MGKIYSVDDVEKNVNERDRNEFKEKLVTDVSDIFGGIFKPKREPEKKKFSLLKWFGILFGMLFLLTIILGCVFLLKIFIKGIF